MCISNKKKICASQIRKRYVHAELMQACKHRSTETAMTCMSVQVQKFGFTYILMQQQENSTTDSQTCYKPRKRKVSSNMQYELSAAPM